MWCQNMTHVLQTTEFNQAQTAATLSYSQEKNLKENKLT